MTDIDYRTYYDLEQYLFGEVMTPRNGGMS
jgi:hypothetical protein